MLLEVVVKYIHFISIFTIIGALVGEHLLIKPSMTRAEIKSLSTIDAMYGVSAVSLVAAGLTLWFGVGKPAEYYSHNWIFLMKVGLFVVIGLLSIYPTVFFIGQRKGNPAEMVAVPERVKTFIRLQLLLMLLIPLLATLMAKGVGVF